MPADNAHSWNFSIGSGAYRSQQARSIHGASLYYKLRTHRDRHTNCHKEGTLVYRPANCCAMGKYTPLLCACALVLCHTPVAKPLVVRSPPRVVRRPTTTQHYSCHHGAPTRSSSMMATPSTPVPRNIKDTVSCLRAAVQVQQHVHIC